MNAKYNSIAKVIACISLALLIILAANARLGLAQNTSVDFIVTKANTLKIFVGANGDDRNDGLTLNTPILTLERAQEVIKVQVPNRDRDVEVRIGPGIYRNQTVEWTFTMPNHTITFMPVFNDKNRPVFDGGSISGRIWFRLFHDKGQKTNLVFHYIRVQNYSLAIEFKGNRNNDGGFNSSNQIYGCYFWKIGKDSTAAVALVHSKNNEIINSHFVDILRSKKCGSLHAIYAAHMSSGNKILRNRFENSCGDPIRIRDFSNNNIINENELIKVGVTAAYTDWYCDHDVRDDCTKPGPECPSWDNQFRNNILNKNHKGQKLKVFKFLQDEHTTGCSPPSSNSHRLRTSGNVHK